MRKSERISRGGQIIRLWSHLNYSEPETLESTVIDMLADLYTYCQSRGCQWTYVVSEAEKWGLKESMLIEKSMETDATLKRLLSEIFPDEDGE